MGIGGHGVLPADAEMDAGLRSDFQANGADFDSAANTPAAPGAPPALMDGTTLSGAMMPAGDAFAAHGDDGTRGRNDDHQDDEIALAPSGWIMKTLFRDWGDTAGDGDGGFETGAIVIKNLGPGTSHPFDRDLAERYINETAQNMFALTVRANGGNPGVTTLATSVYIGANAFTPPVGGSPLPVADSAQWENMVFGGGSLVPDQSQDPNIDTDETFRGTYFGAPGQFQCLGDTTPTDPATGTGCGIARNDDGAVMVIDTDPDTAGIQGGGRWTFTPDGDAMITVPDQDWMAYGAWLTTPDAMTGDHRLGVFFNGMDPWAPAAGSLNATVAAGLRGTATYSGGATGVYVDGAAPEGRPQSGLFTARARLTAVFDADRDGEDDDNEYMISGRIDDFRGTDGVYLGTDTTTTPNDPVRGGENDWVVELGAIDFGTTTDGALSAGAATNTGGSADGVPWTGKWNGQFFGPSEDADGDALHPSGVAGRFWAETPDPDDEQVISGPITAVVGAFGATMDEE